MDEAVNDVAKELYKFILGGDAEQRPWAGAEKSQKAFYRSIAAWHMDKLAAEWRMASDFDHQLSVIGNVTDGIIKEMRSFREKYIHKI